MAKTYTIPADRAAFEASIGPMPQHHGMDDPCQPGKRGAWNRWVWVDMDRASSAIFACQHVTRPNPNRAIRTVRLAAYEAIFAMDAGRYGVVAIHEHD